MNARGIVRIADVNDDGLVIDRGFHRFKIIAHLGAQRGELDVATVLDESAGELRVAHRARDHIDAGFGVGPGGHHQHRAGAGCGENIVFLHAFLGGAGGDHVANVVVIIVISGIERGLHFLERFGRETEGVFVATDTDNAVVDRGLAGVKRGRERQREGERRREKTRRTRLSEETIHVVARTGG